MRTPVYWLAFAYYWTRLRVIHAFHVSQRINVRAAAGCALLVGSHWLPPEIAVQMRDAGTALVVYAFARWFQKQGKRQVNPSTGQQQRHPTLRMSPEEAARIRRSLRP